MLTDARAIDTQISGAKDLVIEPELSSPLSLLVKHSVLKSHGVAQMYHLRGDLVPSTADQTVYLIRRTDTNAVRAIIEHMRSAQSNSIFKVRARYLEHNRQQSIESMPMIRFDWIGLEWNGMECMSRRTISSSYRSSASCVSAYWKRRASLATFDATSSRWR